MSPRTRSRVLAPLRSGVGVVCEANGGGARDVGAKAPPSAFRAAYRGHRGSRFERNDRHVITLSLAAAGAMFATAPSADQVGTPSAVYSTASKPLPLVGRWSLDASLMPESERPQRVTMTFRAVQDGKWTTFVEIVGPDGSRRHAESTAALDGVPVAVTGNMDFIDTVALRQPAPDTLVMTLGKAGARCRRAFILSPRIRNP